MTDNPRVPPQRVETIEIDGRTIPLHTWEAEVLVRASGWIVTLRGLGLVTALLVSAVALIPYDPRVGMLFASSTLLGVVLASVGVGVLCRSSSCRQALLFLVMGWIAFVAHSVPVLFQLGRPYEVHKLAAQPVLLMLLPALFLPDLFATYAVFRPEAEPAFRLSRVPLASVAKALRVRQTGRVLVATGMIVLACLSAALSAFMAPALALL